MSTRQTPIDLPVIDHARRGQRRRPPILRTAWAGGIEAWCPDCGRTQANIPSHPDPGPESDSDPYGSQGARCTTGHADAATDDTPVVT